MKGKASIAIGEICTEFSRSCKSNEGPVKFTCYWTSWPVKKISSFTGSGILVKPVYKGHTREPENVAFMSSCPSYAGENYMRYSLMGKMRPLHY